MKNILAMAVAAASLLAVSAPAHADVTVGNADSGNCYPFSCGPTDGVTEYQQVYSASALPGAFTFNTISFTQFTSYIPGPSMDSGSYQIDFYYSAVGMGLSGALAGNLGALIGNFGTFSLSGPMPSTLSLIGNNIAYDGSADLLMDVTVLSGSSFSGVYNQFFNADYTGVDTVRAWNSTVYGANGATDGALQTTFSGGVPEPATWALMIVGLGGMGVALRSARKAKAALAA